MSDLKCLQIRKGLIEFVKPLNTKNNESNRNVYFKVESGETHFIERLIERNVNFAHFGTTIKRLLSEDIEEVVSKVSEKHSKFLKGESLSGRSYIGVKYKSVVSIFRCFVTSTGLITIVPKTVVANKENVWIAADIIYDYDRG